MLDVLRLIIVRHAMADKARALLTTLGIVLGVAVVFAIHTLNRSVLASFRSTLESVSGKATLTVGVGTGVDEELLETVRAVPGVQGVAPVIEDSVRDVARDLTLVLLAIDTTADKQVRDYEAFADDVKIEDELSFLNDPQGVLITRVYAARHDLKVGDTLSLETSAGVSEFHVRGLLSPRGPAKVFGGDMLVMDVLAAQIALQRGRRFDRLDVLAKPGENSERLARRIEAALHHKVPVALPEQRSQEAERLLASFRLALSITSLVALFVGAFIVYNALAIAVAQRRREIGVLRALGMTRGLVRALFVGEGMLIGAFGSLLGVALGFGLARTALSLVGQTVSTLFVKVQPEQLVIARADVLLAVALGVAASTLAAWFPARRAAQVDPVRALHKQPDAADVSFGSPRRAALTSLAIVLLASVCAGFAHARESTLLAHTVAGLLALAVAMAAPVAGSLVGLLAERFLGRFGPCSALGSQSFRRDAGRSAVAIAALGIALANVVAIDTLLSSMKASTHDWLGRSFRAELFVLGGTDVRAKFDTPMPANLEQILRSDAAVAFVQPFRMARQSYRGEPYYLMSEDLTGYRDYNQLAVSEGNFQSSFAALRSGHSVGISQTFAKRFDLHVGDTLPLPTAQGARNFHVALIYVDYRTDLGAVLIERAIYRSLFDDPLVDLYGVYLRNSQSAAAARARLLPKLAGHGKLLVLENQAYMGELLGLIDRSLSLSHAGEAVALLVAILGMLNTLAVSVLDRKADLATLRALGASPQQVRKVLLTEAALMGFSSALVGIGMGLVLSVYSVRESLRFELGWQLDLTVSIPLLLAVLGLSQVVSVVAAWIPMQRAARLEVASALASE